MSQTTIECKIGLIINANGQWSAIGGHDLDEQSALGSAAEMLDSDTQGAEVQHWVTVRVPVPQGQTLAGVATEAAE